MTYTTKTQAERPIVRTAHLPVIDLALCTDIPFCKETLGALRARGYEISPPTGKAWLAESRYKGAEKIIKEAGLTQVVELGAGFTPHALNLPGLSYVEVDFPEVIQAKEEITRELDPSRKVIYVAGDIFRTETWQKITQMLAKDKLTGFFCEGFMQYTTPEQRKFLAGQILPLIGDKGVFFFEDSLTFHPEFAQVKELRELTERMARLSKNNQLTDYLEQEELVEELSSYGFRIRRKPAFAQLSTADYNEEGSAVLSRFKHWVLGART